MRGWVVGVGIIGGVLVGIAVGAMFPGIWPFARDATAAGSAPAGTSAKSARQIAEDWAQGLPAGQKLTLTPGPKGTQKITLGASWDADSAATAFVVLLARAKFEDVWKHFSDKTGYEGLKELLSGGTRMNPEDLRGGMQIGKGKDQLLLADFDGVGAAKPGGEPGGRESHFAYFTDGHVVHVVIEEIPPDRWESYKGQVKVRIYAAIR
jgi:hypothetical protein